MRELENDCGMSISLQLKSIDLSRVVLLVYPCRAAIAQHFPKYLATKDYRPPAQYTVPWRTMAGAREYPFPTGGGGIKYDKTLVSQPQPQRAAGQPYIEKDFTGTRRKYSRNTKFYGEVLLVRN